MITMDVGIIQAFQLYYRQSVHSHIMHKVKADFTCNRLKDVTIALAIAWVFRACCKGIIGPPPSASQSAASKVRMSPERRLSQPTPRLPELAAGDTEELALSAAEMEGDNIFPPIARAEGLFIEASATIDAEAQRIAGQGSWSRLAWIRRNTNRMMRFISRSHLQASWRV